MTSFAVPLPMRDAHDATAVRVHVHANQVKLAHCTAYVHDATGQQVDRSVTARSIGGYHYTYDQWLEPGSVRVRAGDNATVVCHLGPGALINSVSCAD